MDARSSVRVWRVAECRFEQKEAYSSHSTFVLVNLLINLVFEISPDFDVTGTDFKAEKLPFDKFSRISYQDFFLPIRYKSHQPVN